VDTINLNLPQYYINRELSQIEFNRRVLCQAEDRRLPLLERLKFLCISSTNLDEFFEIRVAGLKQRVEVSSLPGGPDNMSPAEALAEITTATQRLVDDQYRLHPPRRLDRSPASLARAVFRVRDRPGSQPHDSGPDAADSANPQQEPQLHRQPPRPGRFRP
jgi:hypothetical protein